MERNPASRVIPFPGVDIGEAPVEIDALDTDLLARITETDAERDRRLTRLQTVYDANLEAMQAEQERLAREEEARYQLAMHGPGGLVEQIANQKAAGILGVETLKDRNRQLIETAELEQERRERRIEELDGRLADTLADLDRRRADLLVNRDARLKEITAKEAQLIAKKELILQQLVVKKANLMARYGPNNIDHWLYGKVR